MAQDSSVKSHQDAEFQHACMVKGVQTSAKARLSRLMTLGSCPSLYYKASRGSAFAGSQDEMAGRCQLRGNKAGARWLHPPPIPAWGARWAQLLGWQAGNITPGHCLQLSNGNSCYQLPVPSAFFYKTNTILDAPFFSKKSKERFPLMWNMLWNACLHTAVTAVLEPIH